LSDVEVLVFTPPGFESKAVKRLIKWGATHYTLENLEKPYAIIYADDEKWVGTPEEAVEKLKKMRKSRFLPFF